MTIKTEIAISERVFGAPTRSLRQTPYHVIHDFEQLGGGSPDSLKRRLIEMPELVRDVPPALLVLKGFILQAADAVATSSAQLTL